MTEANKQMPLVMHVEYKVKLVDHNFVFAKQHKLIPSVIGNMQVNFSLQMLLHIQDQLILVFKSSRVECKSSQVKCV